MRTKAAEIGKVCLFLCLFLSFALTSEGASRISGGAYFYPENTIYRASFSMDITQADGSAPGGWFKYYYTRTRMNAVSTGISKIEGSGKNATVSGTCTINGSPGFSFRATITDSAPDLFSLIINKQDGTSFYSAGPKSISGGDLVVTLTPPLDITFLSPSNNSTLTTPRVIVQGTFISVGGDAGIAVNGFPASTNGPNWAVNIPLNEGPNRITAKITESTGRIAEKSITVTLLAVPQLVFFSAYPESGTAPFKVNFTMSFEGETNPATFEVDFEGDGIVDQVLSDAQDITFTYSGEGIYYPRLIITDKLGGKYFATTVVNVWDRMKLDAKLYSIWADIRNNLWAENIEGALSFFAKSSRDAYRQQFNLLRLHLWEIANDMDFMYPVRFIKQTAEYDLRVRRDGKEYSYPVLFIVDEDGFWRLKSF